MPRRETRESIERALAEQRRNRRMTRDDFERMRTRMECQIAEMEKKFRDAVHKISIEIRRKRRRPGEGSMPALVEPPRGPKPLPGGTAAPLEFD